MLADQPAPTRSIDGVTRMDGGRRAVHEDVLAVEEPLEIRLAGLSVAVTMRTPGDDFDLASGFLLTEGIIRGVADIAAIAHCPSDHGESEGNVVNVNVTDPSLVNPSRWARDFLATSACGICGKASVESVRQEAPVLTATPHVSASVLLRLDPALREAQAAFQQTGGLHAAALFDPDGNLLTLREDVGRHNAVDKVIGAALRAGDLPLRDRILMVSSRASFEIVQKALMAEIGALVAVSAPSTLAVDLAREAGMTLVGFLREDRLNVYAGEVHD